MSTKTIVGQLLGLLLFVFGGYLLHLELHLASVSTMRVEVYAGMMGIGLLIVIPAQMGAALMAAGRALAGLLPTLLTRIPSPPPNEPPSSGPQG